MDDEQTKTLSPWAVKAYELIYHAEIHYRNKSDYDRTIALISFDNAVEMAITIYLSLNPNQRGGKDYPKKDVQQSLQNFHSKLEFFFKEIKKRKLPIYCKKEDVEWYHKQRNYQYHNSGSGVPNLSTLDDIRKMAIWVFSILFEFHEVESYLDKDIKSKKSVQIPDKHIVPDFSTLNKQELALSATAIVGGWDESNLDDVKIIKRIIDGL